MPENQIIKNSITRTDPHSYAEPNKVTIAHLDLQLTPNFESHQITGVAELKLDWHDDSAKELVLDTKKISIKKIETQNKDGNWENVDYHLDQEDKILGSALQIKVNPSNEKVRIAYETAANAEGLQWLTPKQTAMKTHPYLYSHSEPIMARSWVPIQDTPTVRLTYHAIINTPKDLRAVMSAENKPAQPLTGKFEFNMPQKIPAYLIAFAVGNISSQSIGPRSNIYSEPNIVPPAAKEFEDIEQMIQTAEKLYGPYRWGTYDILVLPPAFTMGGMENPRLTFATPTVIAGDKSLISLVAHELAHSWSGNLVTNAAWDHIWLNEGITSYVTYRIVEEIYGKALADQEFILDINTLYEEMKDLSAPDQRLVPTLDGRDPHDGFTEVAYTKGAWFLKTLEEKFGRKKFDDFLRQYFDHFAFQSTTTEKFEDFLATHLVNPNPNQYTMAQVKEWIYQPGVPEHASKVRSERLERNDKNRQQWLAGNISAEELQAKQWNSIEWLYFLDHLPENLPREKAKALDEVYHLTGMGNHVIAAHWYKIAINSGYTEANDAIREHLLTIGRRVLVAPLYEALLKTELGKHFAQAVYQLARPTYHAVTVSMIDKKFNAAHVEILPEMSRPNASKEIDVDNNALKKLHAAGLACFNPAKNIETKKEEQHQQIALVANKTVLQP